MDDTVGTPLSDVSAAPSIDSLEGAGIPPPPSRVTTSGSFDSLQRHRQRNPRARRPVKETLDARSEYRTSQDDGTAEHRINQYIIKQEIGRGSFGAVHLAADQFGNEYVWKRPGIAIEGIETRQDENEGMVLTEAHYQAVKEFSKSRLRKRAQSHLLRRPRGPQRPGTGFNSPLHRHPSQDDDENAKNPLYLIKEEIAIMKKLNHNNLVSLIEVLDDPTEDSLYMVMEMCKKGVVMKVGLEERADPYDDEHCRCWFRDLILGIEYLHAQGIVHRDIKPDNCLVTNDDVLKVVDFGVSEMFEKDSDMFTAKSAGSPAFLPPELCVVKHGDVSGKAADIWSMGVTLYCLRYGKLPFEQQSIFELYESIRSDSVDFEDEQDDNFKDMMTRILEKDPAKRIKMRDLREHPWVTANGADPLLSYEDNTAQLIEPPTEEELNLAITKNMGHLLTVMKAVKSFKRLVDPSKAGSAMQSILGSEHDAHFVAPPMEMDESDDFPTIGLDPNAERAGRHIFTGGIRKAFGRHPMLAGRGRDEPAERHFATTPLSVASGADDSTTSSGRSRGAFEPPERKDSGSIRSGRSIGKVDATGIHSQSASPHPALSRASSATTKRSVEGTRGHARDPLEEDFPYLFIGPSTYTGMSPQEPSEFNIGSDPTPIFAEPDSTEDGMDSALDAAMSDEPMQIVSESPGAAEFDIYETAYRKELERIKSNTSTFPGAGVSPKVYLTRRVEGKHEVMKFVKDEVLDVQMGNRKPFASAGRSATAFGAAVSLLRNQMEQKREAEQNEMDASAVEGSNPGQESTESQQSPPRERRQSHPPSSSLSSQSIPGPEASSLEATGVPASDPNTSAEDSTTQLRRLLARVRDKNEE
ncbi:Calcium/calmodulin-dependent protein kinase kinase cmkC [Penicillium cataractarum]|uniref:Calcium/calmodulin-dependent protein kinase kinase cmkC n=1 Tax=Penicillium cataractarum TaxID=2100454 RepID=A0A9W9V0X3_9EURO|nr:Calcium/calmodulin-dependent protein kinase kinase cmkC [Penicillium cataractarum]KAJ5364763.1 Calcium/calmodulin-dependent protein kinase kinase cmkC [Penicillium cataractarum]